MSVEVRPLGVECNLACQYCYQNPQRDLGEPPRPYDIERMLAAIDAEDQPFALFGGEPLLVPLPDLERLWAHGLARFGHNRVQTNGTLIEAAHVDAFLRFRVRVGFSIDGPDELNDARWAGSRERTRARTEASHAALRRLCAAGVPTSLILTLHRANAGPERLPRLLAWVRELDALGLLGIRLHLLEVDDPAVGEQYALDTAENLAALEAFAALEPELRMQIDLFGDMRRMLLGDDEQAACVWRACDPYTTAAVRSIEGRGELSNCGRTNKEGVDFGKADVPAHVRSLILLQTPHEHGGCQGCRFFLACKGQCPGTARAGDWRNRSEHCDIYLALFTRLEHDLTAAGRTPLSQSPLRAELERRLAAAWSRGHNPSLHRLLHTLSPTPLLSPIAAPEAPALLPPITAPEAPALLPIATPEAPALHRLPITLPRFLRHLWVSSAARARWQPRLDALRAHVDALELAAAAAGVGALLRDPAPHALTDLRTRAAALGLTVLRLPDRPELAPHLANPTLIAAPDLAAALATDWHRGARLEFLTGLGLPPCCAAAWSLAHRERGWCDGAWLTLADAPTTVAGPPELNRMLARVGLSLLSHDPCTSACAASRELAARRIDLARASDPAALAELLAVLDWPMEWSALHGAVELRTPVVKLCWDTDACAAAVVRQRPGGSWPEHAAVGQRFPYRPPERHRLVASIGWRRGLAHAGARP